jgi:hypothetical protein
MKTVRNVTNTESHYQISGPGRIKIIVNLEFYFSQALPGNKPGARGIPKQDVSYPAIQD